MHPPNAQRAVSLEKLMDSLHAGHNGSGKSSIFRCLGGLWKIPEGGVITKPPVEGATAYAPADHTQRPPSAAPD
eukprot:SAG22_NODE_1357_length_4629_cov_10.880922_2_plen_74_part_00